MSYDAVFKAKTQLMQAAVRVLSADLADEHANADADAEYADEHLALAARELAHATDALPVDKRPVGWDKGGES